MPPASKAVSPDRAMTFGRHIFLSMATAALLGAAESLWVSRGLAGVGLGVRLASSLAIGIGAAGVLGALWGTLQGALARPALALSRRFGFTERIARIVTPDRHADREPVIKFHAYLLGLVPMLYGGLQIVRLSMIAFRRLRSPTLEMDLALIAVGGALCAALIGGVVLGRLLERPVRFLDTKYGLPFPRSPILRHFLYVLVPTTMVCGYVLRVHHLAFGIMAVLFWLPAFLAAQRFLYLVVLRVGPKLRNRLATGVGGAIWAMCLGLLIFVFGTGPVYQRLAVKSQATAAALTVVRNASDVDRDGASSLFGGRDCAPFNRKISPFEPDIPDNDIDENCDGKDSTATVNPAANVETYFGKLEKTQKKKYNVLWIVVDALRADYVHAPGFKGKRKITPQLAQLAKESLVFTRAYTNSSATMFSIPSMMTGIRPENMIWTEKKHQPQLSKEHVLLAERLAPLGYRSAATMTGYLRGQYPETWRGIQHKPIINLDGKVDPWEKRASPITLSLSMDFLHADPAFGTKKADPFFLYAYFDDPHAPYYHHKADGVRIIGKSDKARYSEEIDFTDRYIGMLLDHLRYKKELWANTIVIMTADHGEEFKEHGHRLHSQTCHVESTHVPLMIRIPGVDPQTLNFPVSLVDVVPTLIELMDLRVKPDLQLDGQSLLIPALAPERASMDRPLFCSIVPQLKYMGNFSRRSVRRGNWALMTDDVAGSVELFNTTADPGELEPIGSDARHQKIIDEMLKLLRGNERGNMRSGNWVRG